VLNEAMSGLNPKARAYLKEYLHELKTKGNSPLQHTLNCMI